MNSTEREKLELDLADLLQTKVLIAADAIIPILTREGAK